MAPRCELAVATYYNRKLGGGKVPRTAPSREILSFHGFVRCAALAVISASTEKGSEIEVMFK